MTEREARMAFLLGFYDLSQREHGVANGSVSVVAAAAVARVENENRISAFLRYWYEAGALDRGSSNQEKRLTAHGVDLCEDWNANGWRSFA